jgi:hypothetical protein
LLPPNREPVSQLIGGPKIPGQVRVSRLLKWQRQGYKDDSPFGPTTRAGRLAHAKVRAAARETNPSKAKATKASADIAGARTGEADTDASTSALAEFKAAVDFCVPKMINEAKVEATAYFHKKLGARVA